MNKLKEKSNYYEDIKREIEYFNKNYSYQPKLEDVAFHVK